MTEDQRSLTCIGGYDADVAPARMVLGKIQDQKQKCNLEWPWQPLILLTQEGADLRDYTGSVSTNTILPIYACRSCRSRA